MKPYIASAIAEMDRVTVSRLEHPGSWALDPASCRFLASFVRALGASRIIEFGSGFSTLIMAREIASREGNYLLSIDDSPHYSALAKKAFDTSDCQARVEFRVAPLRPKIYGSRLLLSYSLPKGLLEALGPIRPGTYRRAATRLWPRIGLLRRVSRSSSRGLHNTGRCQPHGYGKSLCARLAGRL